MLNWFRIRALAIAPLLVLSLASLALPHVGDSAHDADGNFTIAVAHSVGGHGVGSPSSPEDSSHHCAICHSARSFRPLTRIAFVSAASVDAAGLIMLHVRAVGTAEIAAQPPLRAPPHSPEHV